MPETLQGSCQSEQATGGRRTGQLNCFLHSPEPGSACLLPNAPRRNPGLDWSRPGRRRKRFLKAPVSTRAQNRTRQPRIPLTARQHFLSARRWGSSSSSWRWTETECDASGSRFVSIINGTDENGGTHVWRKVKLSQGSSPHEESQPGVVVGDSGDQGSNPISAVKTHWVTLGKAHSLCLRGWRWQTPAEETMPLYIMGLGPPLILLPTGILELNPSGSQGTTVSLPWSLLEERQDKKRINNENEKTEGYALKAPHLAWRH
ncbi:uncharacterized protein LOC121936554 [Sceloporus undulatus]|uniref:uncharacterized protein LOC121936554 n=1 Tax=Sceloporus undulatus TaxID=8520 RepID=UPI001C4A8529|nr:uncharacterized protein LOC121936554 [Sceloporus undulatus]